MSEMRQARDAFPSQSIAAVLAHVINQVPYYKRRFNGAEDLSKVNRDIFETLPTLRKRDIQTQPTPFEFFATNIPRDRLIYESTSGSSGTPLRIAKSPEDRLRAAWSAWSVRRWWDPAIWGRRGAAVGLTWRGQTHTHKGDLRLSVNNITSKTLSYYCRRLTTFEPYWMYGIPSAIYRIATYLQEHPSEKRGLALSLVELQGEFLPKAYQNVIQQTFGCGVSNQYGCAELWVLAADCPSGSMHILENDVFIEILDSVGLPVPVGTIGQIVVTSLRMKAMPFIRYEVGDRGRILVGPCACGRSLRRLELTGCRTPQVFTAKDGREFDGAFFVQAIDSASTSAPLCRVVQTYQIVLKNPLKLHFYYEPGPRFPLYGQSLLLDFARRVKTGIDPDMEIRFIQRRSGRTKHKFIIFKSDMAQHDLQDPSQSRKEVLSQ